MLVSVWAIVSVWLLCRLCWNGVDAMWAKPAPFAVPIRIDVNTARVPELMVLDGIGRKRAEQIVLHRVRYGRFRSADELAAVDGIGPETVQRLRPFLKGLRPRARPRLR